MFTPELAAIDYSYYLNFPISSDVHHLLYEITERVWMEKNVHTNFTDRLIEIITKNCEQYDDVKFQEISVYGSICVTLRVTSMQHADKIPFILEKSSKQFWNIIKKYKETKNLL